MCCDIFFYFFFFLSSEHPALIIYKEREKEKSELHACMLACVRVRVCVSIKSLFIYKARGVL